MILGGSMFLYMSFHPFFLLTSYGFSRAANCGPVQTLVSDWSHDTTAIACQIHFEIGIPLSENPWSLIRSLHRTCTNTGTTTCIFCRKWECIESKFPLRSPDLKKYETMRRAQVGRLLHFWLSARRSRRASLTELQHVRFEWALYEFSMGFKKSERFTRWAWEAQETNRTRAEEKNVGVSTDMVGPKCLHQSLNTWSGSIVSPEDRKLPARPSNFRSTDCIKNVSSGSTDCIQNMSTTQSVHRHKNFVLPLKSYCMLLQSFMKTTYLCCCGWPWSLSKPQRPFLSQA